VLARGGVIPPACVQPCASHVLLRSDTPWFRVHRIAVHFLSNARQDRQERVAAFAFAALMRSAYAQDAVAVDPAHHKVEFENDQIRVVHVVFPPGESSVMHSHPCLIAIGVADGELTFRLPDGSTRLAPIRRGEVLVVRQPPTHNPVNNSGTTHDVMVVELKTGCPK